MTRGRAGWRVASLRVWRLAALAGIVWLIADRHADARRSGAADRPLTAREVAAHGLDAATELDPAGDDVTPRVARDAFGTVIGHALRTLPSTRSLVGYVGPSDVLVTLDAAAERIADVALRSSADTPGHVADVATDDAFWAQWRGRAVADIAAGGGGGGGGTDGGFDTVSGATKTSRCVIASVRHRLTEVAGAAPAAARPTLGGLADPRQLALLAVVGTGLWIAWRKPAKRVRRAFQLVVVGYVGLATGDLLALSLASGWATSGSLPWAGNALGLAALAAAAVLVPWAGGPPVYCAQLCPHGAVQEGLQRATPARWRRTLPGWLRDGLRTLPFLLLATAITGAALALPFDLAGIEAFDAWLLGGAALASIVVAIVGLAFSATVGMGYCRYGCPTGALLRFVRTPRRARGPTRADAAALALLALAYVLTRGGGDAAVLDFVSTTVGSTGGTGR